MLGVQWDSKYDIMKMIEYSSHSRQSRDVFEYGEVKSVRFVKNKHNTLMMIVH